MVIEANIPIGDQPTEKFGDIPINWRIYSIQELIDKKHLVGHLDGNHGELYPSSDEFTEIGIPYIGANDFSKGYIDYKSCKYLPEERARIFKKGIAKYGDVLFAHNATVGPVALIKTKFEYVILSTTATYFRCNQEKLLNIFLLYALQAPFFVNQYQSVMAQSTRNQVPITVQRKFSLLLPPLPEQKAIAQSLSDVDTLITECDRIITKKRNTKQGTMQQLLTGKKRLPGFGNRYSYKQTEIGQIPEDWMIKPLKTVSSMNGRIGWQGLKQEEFTFNESDPYLITGINFKDGKIRWKEVYHIPEKRYQEAKNIQLKENDILMTKDGTIGKLLYVEDIPFPGKASLNSHLLVFRPLNRSYEPRFLFYQLSYKQFADYVDLNKSGSTFFGITQEAVGNYRTYLPPLPEQKAIAQILSDMDAEIEALEQKRDKYKAIKQGMMQELLTGKTRLKSDAETKIK